MKIQGAVINIFRIIRVISESKEPDVLLMNSNVSSNLVDLAVGWEGLHKAGWSTWAPNQPVIEDLRGRHVDIMIQNK